MLESICQYLRNSIQIVKMLGASSRVRLLSHYPFETTRFVEQDFPQQLRCSAPPLGLVSLAVLYVTPEPGQGPGNRPSGEGKQGVGLRLQHQCYA